MVDGLSANEPGRLTRRAVARAGLLVAGAVVTGWSAAACSSGGAAQGGTARQAATVQPTSAGAKVKLKLIIPYYGVTPFHPTMEQLVSDYFSRNWLPKHPGVEVTFFTGAGDGGGAEISGAQTIVDTLSGDPADIIVGASDEWPQYRAAKMMLPLDSLVRADNLDLSGFSHGHITALTTTEGLLGLPATEAPSAMAINLQILDDVGLPYPEDSWTHDDAARLWRQLTGNVKGKWRYGCALGGPNDWIPRGWGGATGNSAGTQCLLDSSQATGAYQWYWDLALAKTLGGDVTGGTAAMGARLGVFIQHDVVAMKDLKWKYLGMPHFPAGPTTYTPMNFLSINAFSKQPADLLWDVFKFLALDSGYQQLLWQATFATPNRVDQWPDWTTLVEQIAPPLRNKNLQAYAAAATYSWPVYYFRSNNAAAQAVLTTTWSSVQKQVVSVPLALRQATDQVNAVETAGAAEDQKSLSTQKTVTQQINAAKSGQLNAFTKPAVQGFGIPFRPDKSLVKVQQGVWTVLGGASMIGRTVYTDHGLERANANGTFAGSTVVAPSAAFVCRVVSVDKGDEKALDGAVRVGLMVRADLSNAAPMVAVTVGPEGVSQSVQQQPGLVIARQTVAGSFLGKPVWLRITRKVDRFVSEFSQDGTKWNPVGTETALVVGGVWVGLFATSNQGGKKIVAKFDDLSGFAPDSFGAMGW